MSINFSLTSRVALVTGGGRGLGFEIAQAMAAAGAHVLINGRNKAQLDQAVSQIASEGYKATPLPFDVAKEQAVVEAFAGIKERYGRLDILVNNVGMRDRRKLLDIELAAARQLIDVDLVAPFHLSQQAAQLMIPQAWGRILNITSIAGPIAPAFASTYTAAKGGLEALTRALSAELGPHGITANAIAPGYFATETNAAMVADPDNAAWLQRRTSLGRWGEPHEIAGAAVFLCSPAANYITGQLLAVDGGYLAHF